MSKQKKKDLFSFLVSLLLNISLVIISMRFHVFQFGTNDDRDVSNLLGGAYDCQYNEYIVFVNVYFCRMIRLLHKIFPGTVNWYVVVSLFLCFIAFVILCQRILYHSQDFKVGIILAVVLLGLLYQSHYVIFQFTHNAILLSISGCMLLIEDLFYQNKGYWLKTAGGFLLMTGSMIRFQSVYFTIPYLGICYGCEILFRMNGKFTERLYKIKYHIIWIFIVLSCVFLVRCMHLITYNSNPVLVEYYETNKYRVELCDYGVPEYEANNEKFHDLHLSEEDLEMLSNQAFWDQELFSKDVMKELTELKKEKNASLNIANFKISSAGQLLQSIADSTKESCHWLVIFGAITFFLLCSNGKRGDTIAMALAFTVIVNWYFVSIDRLPYRVWYSFIAPLAIFTLFMCSIKEPAEEMTVYRKILCAAALYIMLLFININVSRQVEEDRQTQLSAAYECIIRYAEEHPDELVLLDRPTTSRLTYISTVTPLRSLEAGSHDNIFYLGGWICWTPANKSTLNRFGIENLRDAVEKNIRITLIDDSNFERIQNFFRKHYNKSVFFEEYEQIPDSQVKIYKLRIVNKSFV